MFNNEKKKEWVEGYKKVLSEFRNEERRLIQTLSEDFHINKIFLCYAAEVENDKKILEESRLNIKYYIDEAFSYFKGAQKGKNFDIKQRLLKIKEAILKSRVENKNKFEALLLEEDELEKELQNFETQLIAEKEENEELEEATEEVIETNNNPTMHINKNLSELDEYIEYVIGSGNIVFEKYTDDDVAKIVNRLNEMNLLKNKTSQIEALIEKLGGQNLGWQTNYHQDFLRLKAIHNGKVNTYEFLTALENTLPFFPKSELKNHIRLYNKYNQLYEVKKLLVNRYKSIKAEKEEIDKKQVLEKVISPAVPQSQPITPQIDKKKLEEWKLKKQQDKEAQEQMIRMQERQKREMEKLKYLERTNKVKPMIEEFKKQKELEKEKQIEKVEKIEISEIDLERIKEKNDKLLENKILIMKNKPDEKIKRAKTYVKYKLKKMEKLDSMDPKLEEKTEGYMQKERKKHDPQKDKSRMANTMGGNVLFRTTRAVPEWRKAL